MITRKEEITYTFVFIIYRGYYMAARRYESFSSSVEKYFTSERSKRVKYFFNTRREISYLRVTMQCSIQLNTKH